MAYNRIVCSTMCFKLIIKKDIEKEIKKLSIEQKSLIILGLHIFSYNPCKIWQILFPNKYVYEILEKNSIKKKRKNEKYNKNT